MTDFIQKIIFLIGLGIWIYAIIDTTIKTGILFTISIIFMIFATINIIDKKPKSKTKQKEELLKK